MRYSVLVILFFVFQFDGVFAQNDHCGQDVQHTANLISRYLSEAPLAPRDDQYIPLVFQLIGDDGGNIDILYNDIYEAVCLTNGYFSESGLQFYILSIDRPFSSSSFEDDPLGNSQLIEMTQHPQALDIFVANFSPASGFDLFSSFTSFTYDAIFIRDEALNGTSQALAHQLGHYFHLLHPFAGWLDVISPEEYYDPTGGNSAVAILPNGIVTELVDGSNCESSGDLICDTPPDFFFGSYFQGCPQNATILDANGQLIPWMPGNIMGSFVDCPTENYFFSPQQNQVMLADYLNPEKDYLRELPAPTLGTITQETVVLIAPISGATLDFNGLLQWTSAGENISYIVEFSRLPGFNLMHEQFVATDTFINLNNCQDFDPYNYYWRVRPVTAGNNCTTSFSSVESFEANPCIDITNDKILQLEWRIYPNPVSHREGLQLSTTLPSPQVFSISLSTITGELISRQKQEFQAETSIFTIPKPNLPTGVYLITLEAEGKTSTKRLIVQ
ncbi:zinc-dependent metalloprotease [Lewinella cohaerens]|uniref:zinc-dependent metalloprotease n=1 Tax=Lewinella cohaerens TaxID=70995 RepID=UPI000366D2AF|nr:zinc-dependent metalloprotease [Lewinella cohaerens]